MLDYATENEKMKEHIFNILLDEKSIDFCNQLFDISVHKVSKGSYSINIIKIFESFQKIQLFFNKLSASHKTKLRNFKFKDSFAKKMFQLLIHNYVQQESMRSLNAHEHIRHFEWTTFKGNNFYVTCDNNKETMNWLWLSCLIEYCIFKFDQNYFKQKINNDSSMNHFFNYLSWYDFENTMFLYGNGLNNYFEIEWLNENEIYDILEIYVNWKPKSCRKDKYSYELRLLLDSINLYAEFKHCEYMQDLAVFDVMPFMNYEDLVFFMEKWGLVFTSIKSNPNMKKVKKELEQKITNLFDSKGKNLLKKFDIRTHKMLHKFFVTSLLVVTTNYDSFYDKDPNIKVHHLHGNMKDNNILFSTYEDKFNKIGFGLGNEFFDIRRVMIFGWSGKHEPHINMSINGNPLIEEILIIDKFSKKHEYYEFMTFNKYKHIFPNKKVFIIHCDDLEQYWDVNKIDTIRGVFKHQYKTDHVEKNV